jgi:hypothetical protein
MGAAAAIAKNAMAMTPSLFGLSRGEVEAGVGSSCSGRAEIPTGSWVIRLALSGKCKAQGLHAEVLEGPLLARDGAFHGKGNLLKLAGRSADLSHNPNYTFV